MKASVALRSRHSSCFAAFENPPNRQAQRLDQWHCPLAHAPTRLSWAWFLLALCGNLALRLYDSCTGRVSGYRAVCCWPMLMHTTSDMSGRTAMVLVASSERAPELGLILLDLGGVHPCCLCGPAVALLRAPR